MIKRVGTSAEIIAGRGGAAMAEDVARSLVSLT
jgi:hypothetical protein